MKQYNVEVFDNHYNYRSSTVVSSINIATDYLVISKNSIKVSKSLEVAKGDYMLITSGDEKYQGIVNGVEDDKNTKKVEITDFMKLTDINVHYDKTDLTIVSLEEFIATILRDSYQNNADNLQNIPGFRVEVLSSTKNAKLNIEENIGNLKEIILKAFHLYDIIITFGLSINNKELVATIQKTREEIKVIEADLENILDKNFVFRDSTESLNKVIVINKNDESRQAIFYRTTTDEITTENRDRITPVVFDTVYVDVGESEDFYTKAEEEALNQLTPEKFDNLIELTVKNEDPLILPEEMKIGDTADILRDGIIYRSVLTGIERGTKTKLIFGSIRIDLTQILKRGAV